MQKINTPADVQQYCAAQAVHTAYNNTDTFQTTATQTAVVLQQLGQLYYIDCVPPGQYTVERLIKTTHQITMRMAPKLIAQRLDYLEGTDNTASTIAKHALYLALRDTPELQLLNELEGHTHTPQPGQIQWLTPDTQVRIRNIYNNIHKDKCNN